MEFMSIYVYFMLYGPEGGGRGRKSKYTVLPRGVRVQFDFSNWPAVCPSTVHFFKLSCRAAEYSLVFQTVLPGGRVQLTSRPRPIDPATGRGCRTILGKKYAFCKRYAFWVKSMHLVKGKVCKHVFIVFFIRWHYDIVTGWQDDRMTGWQDDMMTGCQDDKMTGSKDGRMTGWQGGRMTGAQ